MRIGVCIPGHYGNLPFFDACLHSIARQTRLPDIVCVSISGVPEGVNLPTTIPSFPVPVEIVTTTDVQYEGKNRNVAAARIADRVDVLTFFDMDDIMLPWRTQVIEKAYTEEPNAGVFIHQFMTAQKQVYNRNQVDRLLDRVTPPNNVFVRNCFECMRDSTCGRVISIPEKASVPIGYHANGWVTVRTDLWRETKFEERGGVGVDSEYVWQVYQNHADEFILCTDYLGVYMLAEWTACIV